MSAPRINPHALGALTAVIAVTLAAQLVGLGLLGAAPTPGVALALLGPLTCGVGAVAWYLRTFILVRVKNVTLAMHAIADGDFTVRLGEPPSEEFRAIREAFTRMAVALDASRRRVAEADARRRRLFADLAHELATPASTVLALADTFAQPDLVPDGAAWRGLTAALGGEAQLLARLVDDVRDLAALEDPDVTFVRDPDDLRPIVARAVEGARALGGAAIRFAAPDTAVRVACDRARVEQLARILLANAHRYTPADGAVAVTVDLADGRARLVVEDSGPGVPDALLVHLGERLFRADASRDRRTGGHGLGLSIARRIVARHDGTIAFDRAPLGGLRASVSLPLAP